MMDGCGGRVACAMAALGAMGVAELAGPWGQTALAQCEPVRLVSPSGPDAREFGSPAVLEAGPAHAADILRLAIGEDRGVWSYEMVDGALRTESMHRSPFNFMAFLFGMVVGLEGDRMAIGAYEVRWPGRSFHLRSVGGAAVYERRDGQWAYAGALEAPLLVTSESAASAPFIDGDTIIGAGAQQGQLIVFRPAPGTPNGWEPVQTIERPEGMPREATFGFGLDAKDGWLFVGAHRERFPEARVGGSVLAYRQDDQGVYQFVQKINGPDLVGYPIALFGRSIAFDGRTLAIGAIGASPSLENQGAVYVFEFDAGAWTLRQTLTHSGARADHQFGSAGIQVDGDRLVAQAWGDRTDRSDHAAYAFERTATGVWRQSARLLPTTPYHAGAYANAMSLVGDRVLVGAADECEGPGEPNTGAAYLFDLSCYECPDLDADDRLTIFDTLEFLRAFEAGEAIADFDNDGELTVLDYTAFQDAFAVGCP